MKPRLTLLLAPKCAKKLYFHYFPIQMYGAIGQRHITLYPGMLRRVWNCICSIPLPSWRFEKNLRLYFYKTLATLNFSSDVATICWVSDRVSVGSRSRSCSRSRSWITLEGTNFDSEKFHVFNQKCTILSFSLGTWCLFTGIKGLENGMSSQRKGYLKREREREREREIQQH